MLEDVEVLCHSSIRFHKGRIIYFDPFKIDKNYHDADIIFITHDHYDHYSIEDINKVIKEDSVLVIPKNLLSRVVEDGFSKEKIMIVEINQNYDIAGLTFRTIPSYNKNKPFHPKENHWVGYLIELEGITYYIAGDTDAIEENRKLKCDVAFVPVGGVYTMDYQEAAELVNEIKPKIAVPTHYGSIVGHKEDGMSFSKLVDPNIKCYIFIK